MKTTLLSGPCHVEEALFGIGLSYGLTSNMQCDDAFRKSPVFRQLCGVARKLSSMQGGHNKFLETPTLTLDITAPRYWWQEFDTYRAGVTKQSESTIHTIMARELTPGDFEGGMFDPIMEKLNDIRHDYLKAEAAGDEKKKMCYFADMKATLPEGFLQRRIVTLNLKTLQNIYNQRKNHRLNEWREFLQAVFSAIEENCIYAEDIIFWITGKELYEKGDK